jgi:signal transduction histidine kinase
VGSPLVDVDVNAAVTSALVLFQAQLRIHGIQFKSLPSKEMLWVLAAPNTIEQVILNLLTNARDAVLKRMNDNKDHEGRIEIESSPLDGTELCVEVRDNGGGVPTAILEKIFDPFFTTKDVGKGTGLGLSISQRIVNECGGRIEPHVQEGEGTTFRVILPISQATDKKDEGLR